MGYALALILLLPLALVVIAIRSAKHAPEDSQPLLEEGSATPALSNRPISKWDFRTRILTELLGRDPSLDITPEDMTLIIRVGPREDDEVITNLHNIYARYWDETDRLDEFVFKFSDITMEAIAAARGYSSETSQEQLAVVLRHTDYLNVIDAEATVWTPFLGDLIALMVFNHPQHIVSANKTELTKLGLSEADAWAIAAENLKVRYNDIEIIAENSGSKVVSAQSGLATGHLCLRVTQFSPPDFFAMVINRESYAYAEADDETAMQVLAGYGAELVEIEDTLSENLVSCAGGIAHALRLEGFHWVPIED